MNHDHGKFVIRWRIGLLVCAISVVLKPNVTANIIVASFRFAQRMILGRLECQFHLCVLASNLPSIGTPNSTTGPDNRRGEDATFGAVAEAIHRANKSSRYEKTRTDTLT